MQKQRRELGLKRFWSAVKSSNSSSGSQCEHGDDCPPEETKPPHCSLPLLQVWPSSDSPRGEADGQSFVFPPCPEDPNPHLPSCPENATHDSGIDSTQASPLPSTVGVATPPTYSPPSRRPSAALLHPDHARSLRLPQGVATSPAHSSAEELSDSPGEHHVLSPSSSTTSSMTSIAAAMAAGACLDGRRRSSAATARYSVFDALDLEYALLRAAARGSVGPYSLSESLHKLTFTQSLAFPGLARGLAGKRMRSQQGSNSRTPLDAHESGLNTCAKLVTALVLVLISVLVFAVVYKFVRT